MRAVPCTIHRFSNGSGSDCAQSDNHTGCYLGRSLVTAAWISATRARSMPQGWSTPTRLSRSHRTHCSPGIATSCPRDDGPAQLLVHRVCGRRDVSGCATDRMVVHELSIGLCAKSLIPHGAQDQAVPGLIHRARRHPDHLFVRQCGRAAAQPLPQTSLDELTRLPRARFEYGRGKLEFCHRGKRPIKPVTAPALPCQPPIWARPSRVACCVDSIIDRPPIAVGTA